MDATQKKLEIAGKKIENAYKERHLIRLSKPIMYDVDCLNSIKLPNLDTAHATFKNEKVYVEGFSFSFIGVSPLILKTLFQEGEKLSLYLHNGTCVVSKLDEFEDYIRAKKDISKIENKIQRLEKEYYDIENEQ